MIIFLFMYLITFIINFIINEYFYDDTLFTQPVIFITF